jgi:hypothetical protein
MAVMAARRVVVCGKQDVRVSASAHNVAPARSSTSTRSAGKRRVACAQHAPTSVPLNHDDEQDHP